MAEQQQIQTSAGADQDVPSPFFAWIQAKQKYVAATAVVVAAIGLGTWFMIESGRRKEAFASEALDRARTAIEAGNYPQASADLQKITQNYRGTDAALEAGLALNQVRMMSGQSKLAVDELTKFAATNPPPYFSSAAQFLLGTALENTGKLAEAAQAYQKSADIAEEPYRKVDALLQAARAFRLAGKDKDAVVVLQKVIKDFPETTAGYAEAQVRLGEVTKGQM